MRAAVASVDPALPVYDVMTLDERIAAAIAQPRFTATLLAAFAAAALMLSAIGVYGLLSYSVSSRMRDIGVRLALGANTGRVVRMVLGEGLRLTVIGAAIGFTASFLLARVTQSLLSNVSGWNVRLVAVSGIVMTAAAGAAAFMPARRAAAVDPIVVLRHE
jgi:ABC-type antimicrobial peptide transport system permease subunit